VSRDTVIHNQRLRHENDKTRQTAATTKQSCHPQLARMNRVARSQVKISANALIIMAKALASMFINTHRVRYAEAMDSPQRDDWKRAMEEECRSILLSSTFTTINSREARHLQVKSIHSKWVYNAKHNPDGTIRYNAHLEITGYEQTDCGETYALVGTLTTVRNISSLDAKHRWIIDHLNVVTAFLNSEVDDNNIYMTLPER
jgi:hypothetical protein